MSRIPLTMPTKQRLACWVRFRPIQLLMRLAGDSYRPAPSLSALASSVSTKQDAFCCCNTYPTHTTSGDYLEVKLQPARSTDTGSRTRTARRNRIAGKDRHAGLRRTITVEYGYRFSWQTVVAGNQIGHEISTIVADAAELPKLPPASNIATANALALIR